MDKYARLVLQDVIHVLTTLMYVKFVKKVLSWMTMIVLKKVFPFC